jgi:cation transport ATPase
VEKKIDAKVTGGTINGTGSFTMKTERVGAETLLAQIVKMVSEAQRSRAPIQRLADVVASYFVPAVLLSAVITFVVWAIYGPQPHYAHALVNAVAVLIIACPCAPGLATPMAIMVGTGRGAREGVLISNAEALEILEKVNTLVVDKTGTLTLGKPKLAELIPAEGVNDTELLQAAASLERASEHPLAAAILTAAKEKNIELVAIDGFHSVTGKKAAVVKKLPDAGATVAMAGDEVNDAPALAQAHVGIAMGTGTDVAMKTGGITLVKGDLRGILKARRLSHLTMNNIRENLFFAFFYKRTRCPFSGGRPLSGLWVALNPMIAAAAMSFSSVSVIVNALRLKS